MWNVRLFTEEYSAVKHELPSCLLLSGWSFDTAIFEWILPGLAQQFTVSTADVVSFPEDNTFTQLVDVLAQLITAPTWLIGWSLGGNIAIELASRYPDKVLGLCLLATTPLFIANQEWLVGISPESFDIFERGLSKNVERTLARFDAMQCTGDSIALSLAHAFTQYRTMQVALPSADLQRGLQLLRNMDQRKTINELTLPMLWCFGEVDPLINAYTAYEVKQLCPLAETYVFRQAAHSLFLSQPDKCFNVLLSLLNKAHFSQEKKRIAHSFSRAAKHYDEYAELQKNVAQELLENVNYSHGILLDVGCGTGYWLDKMLDKADYLIGFDMSHGMLMYGREHYDNMQHVVEGDFEYLPFIEHSISQIFSSLSIQWSMNINGLLEEWYRVLKPGGKVYLATLGAHTLYELRDSWSKVDGFDHVNRFMSAEALCECVYQSAFNLKSIKVENKVIAYRDVRTLMRELKNIGAQTVLGNEHQGLMGKQRFSQLDAAYDQYRNAQGVLPATYEVIYITLEKHQ